jgi:hypothetical protein
LDGLIPPLIFPQEKPTTWEVYFSPKGGCTDAIVRELDKAQGTVLVQAYSFRIFGCVCGQKIEQYFLPETFVSLI